MSKYDRVREVEKKSFKKIVVVLLIWTAAWSFVTGLNMLPFYLVFDFCLLIIIWWLFRW